MKLSAVFLVPMASWCAIACANDPAPVSPTPTPTASGSVSAPPTVVASTSATTPPPPKDCLPQKTLNGEIVHVEVKDGKVLACFLDEGISAGNDYPEAGQKHPCVSVDPETGTATSAPPYTVPDWVEPSPPSGPFTLTTTTNSFTVCPVPSDKSKCKTVAVQGVMKPKKAAPKPPPKPKKGAKKPPPPPPPGDEGAPLFAFADATGSKVFVFVPDASKPEPKVWGDVYEVKTGKRLSHVNLTHPWVDGKVGLVSFNDLSNTLSGSFLSDTRVVLTDAVCCGPGAQTLLVDPAKGTMLSLHGYQGTFVQDPTSKAYVALDSKKLSAIDVDKLVATAIVTAPGEAPNPENFVATYRPIGAKGALISARPPAVTSIDPVAKTAGTPHPLPLCPP